MTGDDGCRITMAVSGFNETDLTLEVKPNVLTISGKKTVKIKNVIFCTKPLPRDIPETMKPRIIPVLNRKAGNLMITRFG